MPAWTYSTPEPADSSVSRFTASSTFSAAKGLEDEILIRLGHILEMPGIAFDQINKGSCPYRLANTPIEKLNLVQIWREARLLGSERLCY